MNFVPIFFDDSNRVRSGWRAAAYVISCFITAVVGATLLGGLLIGMGVPLDGTSPIPMVLQFVVFCSPVIFFGWLYGRVFEKLPFRALGVWFTGGWFRDLLVGLAFGALSLLIVAAIVFGAGFAVFERNSASGSGTIAETLLRTLVIFVAGAAFEESFLRGYFLQTFFRSRLAVFGIIFTSLVFATLHNANPGANVLTWSNTFLAGIWLAVAYEKTRSLWFPFGIHLAWNWVQGSVLGIPVSGLEKLAPDPLLRGSLSGPEWFSGGNYGLEGGIACTIGLIVSTVVIWKLPFPGANPEMIALTSPPVSDPAG